MKRIQHIPELYQSFRAQLRGDHRVMYVEYDGLDDQITITDKVGDSGTPRHLFLSREEAKLLLETLSDALDTIREEE